MEKKLTLLIDADDTILDFNKAEYEAILRLCKCYDIPNAEQFAREFKKLNRKLWDMFEQGQITREQIFYSRFEKLFELYGIENKDVIEVGDSYREFVAESKCIIRGARAFLSKMYNRHDMYCITNGVTRTQIMRMKNSKLDKYFKKLFISQEMGLAKPSKEYFDYVLNYIKDYDLNYTYIIGDSLTSDIQGGINSGIKTILFNKENKKIAHIVPDYEVKGYKELIRLIDKLANN